MSDSNFTFVGEALALDLVNTDIIWRGNSQDLLETPADLAQWWQEVQGHYELPPVEGATSVFDQADLAGVKELRDGLRRFFQAVVNDQTPVQADLDLLNSRLSLGRQTLSATGQGLQGIYQLNEAAHSSVGFEVALSAYQLITSQDLARLHRCRNKRCVLFFYDHTKSATRHWCSPACMNRARSVEHYRQTKTEKV